MIFMQCFLMTAKFQTVLFQVAGPPLQLHQLPLLSIGTYL